MMEREGKRFCKEKVFDLDENFDFTLKSFWFTLFSKYRILFSCL